MFTCLEIFVAVFVNVCRSSQSFCLDSSADVAETFEQGGSNLNYKA